ncbi:MAG: FHA domain-containing protein [Eubacteriales bacterium]
MQILLVVGRILFIALIYLLLIRIITVLLADLGTKGIFPKTQSDIGCLEVISGSEMLPKGRKIKIEYQGVRIGRGKQNDIIVNDHYCSLDHAEFRQRKGATFVEDIGSTNGTWVNGEKINTPIQLAVGDFIKIGSITFQYSRWRNESL